MDAALPTTTPTRLGRVLGLVRSLIDFGCGLADNFRQGTVTGFDFRYRARLFGTADVATILLRIARGLRCAAALQTLLLARAQRGKDLIIAPARIYAPRTPSPTPRPYNKRPPLPLEPSDAEIAASIRRRRIGAIIVDICHDLGVQPGELGHDVHRELMDVVMCHGGNPIRLLRLDESMRRAREYIAILRSDAPLPPALQPFPWPQRASTGPPA